MQTSLKAFNQVGDKYKFNVLLFENTSTSEQENQLLYQLVRSDDWKSVYINNTVIILLKNSQDNQVFIKEHLINENNLVVASADLGDKNKVRQLANLFKHLGWYRKALEMNLKYLQYIPTDCGAIGNVAYLLQKENDPASSIYINKYLQTCK